MGNLDAARSRINSATAPAERKLNKFVHSGTFFASDADNRLQKLAFSFTVGSGGSCSATSSLERLKSLQGADLYAAVTVSIHSLASSSFSKHRHFRLIGAADWIWLTASLPK